MIKNLGKLISDLTPFYSLAERDLIEAYVARSFFNHIRFYIGNACSSYNVWHTVEVMHPQLGPFYEGIIAECSALLSKATEQEYTYLREAMLCMSGSGQSNKPFTNANWLAEITKRIHIVLRGTGTFNGIHYGPGDVLLVDEPLNADIVNKFTVTLLDKYQEHLVLSYGLAEQVNIRSWDLFKKFKSAS